MTGSGTVLSPDASGTSQTTLNLAFQATGQATFSPDALNLHIAMAMTDPGSGSPTGAMTFDVVEVNHLVYIKGLIQMPGQPAQQSDMYSVTDAQSLGTSADLASVLAPPLTDLTTVGQQTIRGDKCWHLTGVDMTSGNASTTAPSTPADVDVWVRRSDGRIVQIQTHSLGALGVLFGAGEGMDFSPSVTLTFALTAFDKGITIGSPPADQVQD